MEPDNLQETIKLIRKGDQGAFRSLVTTFQQPACRLAFRILGNEEEARDSVQESFIKIWQKIGSFDPAREFTPWMYRIVVNTASDRLRKINRHVMIPIERAAKRLEIMQQGDPAATEDNRELAILIKGLADNLPEKQKLVFILRDIEGMASAEVEVIMEMPETSVKSNLYFARKSVRERLLKILEKERSIK